MDLVAAPASSPAGFAEDTGFPLGNMICPACQVSWPPFAPTCWACGQPGMTSGQYGLHLAQHHARRNG